MKTHQAAFRNRTTLLYLLLCGMFLIASACKTSVSQNLSSVLPVNVAAGTPLPEKAEATAAPTGTAAVIPATGLDNLSITGCPDWDVHKMYEHGEYLYEFYCARCHGREGQGVVFTSPFPPLTGTTLAASEDISPALHFMMNTDLHPHASLLFEKDALSIINYIRVTFANNTDLSSVRANT